VALDLGCAPGSATRLLAEVTGAGRTVGIDTSSSFLEVASATPAPFVRQDATTVPLPGAPVDLIYCRLLLAHVPDPVAAVRAWATQLTPGGRLLVDEMEWIDTSIRCWRRTRRWS
jgi:trans-aconitate 2-methyltransferase